MSDQTPDNALAAEADAQQPPAGAHTQNTEAQAATDTEAISLEEARKLRREAQALRKRLADYEKSEGDRQAANLSEVERTRKELDTLKAQHEQAQAQIRRYTVLEAVRTKAADIKLDFHADALADAYKVGDFDSLEIDDEGKIGGIADVLKDLARRKPWLLRAAEQVASPNINAGTRSTSASINPEQREAELRERFNIRR